MTQDWVSYSRQQLDDDDIAAVEAALRSGWLTTGPAVEAFEKALGDVVGAPAAALSSGTAALHAAYFAAGLGPGAELITSPMTFVATASAALHLGAHVSFADVEDGTLNIDPRAVSAAVSSRTRVITAVDFAGHPGQLEALANIADSAGAVLVEDASHSLGATYRGAPVGSLADLTTFSFHPVKVVTTGEGGAVSAPNLRYLDAVKSFRSHGMVRDPELHKIEHQGEWHQEVQSLGLNYRLPDPLAALGISQLRKLDRFIELRRSLAERYSNLLADVDGMRLPQANADVGHAWHLFPVRVLDGRRRTVFDHMRANGIGVQVHYLPAHRHPIFQELGYRQGMCPVAEQAYEELLTLPLFPGLVKGSQDRVVEVLTEALA